MQYPGFTRNVYLKIYSGWVDFCFKSLRNLHLELGDLDCVVRVRDVGVLGRGFHAQLTSEGLKMKRGSSPSMPLNSGSSSLVTFFGPRCCQYKTYPKPPATAHAPGESHSWIFSQKKTGELRMGRLQCK